VRAPVVPDGSPPPGSSDRVLVIRGIRVPPEERAWFRGVLEAYDGLAVWFAGSLEAARIVARGVPGSVVDVVDEPENARSAPDPEDADAGSGGAERLWVLTPPSQLGELDRLLEALRRENPRLS